MASTGRYLYGLIRSDEAVEFGAIGLAHDGGPGRVRTVLVDSMGAVVSDFTLGGRLLPLRKNLPLGKERYQSCQQNSALQ